MTKYGQHLVKVIDSTQTEIMDNLKGCGYGIPATLKGTTITLTAYSDQDTDTELWEDEYGDFFNEMSLIPVWIQAEGYTPQGITLDASENIYISVYKGDGDEVSGILKNPSTTTTVDDLYYLTDNIAHVGGMTIVDDKIYIPYEISSSSDTNGIAEYAVPTDDTKNLKQTQIFPMTDDDYSSYTNSAGCPSDLSYDGTNFWTAKYTTEAHCGLMSFNLDVSGTVTPLIQQLIPITQIQGVAIDPNSSDTYKMVWLSQSYGNKSCYLYRYDIEKKGADDWVEVGVSWDNNINTPIGYGEGIFYVKYEFGYGEDLEFGTGFELWSLSESSTKRYETSGYFPYMYSLDVRTIGNSHFHTPTENVGTLQYQYMWRDDYTAVECVSDGTDQYAIMYSDTDGRINIVSINNNSSLSTSIKQENDIWTHSDPWTIFRVFTIENNSYLFILKNNTGDIKIHKFESGVVGDLIQEKDWSSNYSDVMFFTDGGDSYILLYKITTGRIVVHKMKNDGSIYSNILDTGNNSEYESCIICMLSAIEDTFIIYQIDDPDKPQLMWVDIDQKTLLYEDLTINSETNVTFTHIQQYQYKNEQYVFMWDSETATGELFLYYSIHSNTANDITSWGPTLNSVESYKWSQRWNFVSIVATDDDDEHILLLYKGK